MKTQQAESFNIQNQTNDTFDKNSTFIQNQKKNLLEIRDYLTNRMETTTREVLRSSGDRDGVATFGLHQADAGTDTYDCDFALSLLSQENNSLKQIQDALKRIENDTYGICEDCGKKIPKLRLEALPFARRTVDCQEKHEQQNSNNNLNNNFRSKSDLINNFNSIDIELPNRIL